LPRIKHQALPAAGPKREALREKGQFWTPQWVAEAMVTYTLLDACDEVFDPAVGGGAFFQAAKTVAKEHGRSIRLRGTELHASVLDEAREHGLTAEDLTGVEITDFVMSPPPGPFCSIVANPPYIRHHRLPATTKVFLRELATRLIGEPLDGRTGFHVYFLLRALERLAPAGRLAFIMPADTCEGVFADALWGWITKRFYLEGVVTFDNEATPFPGVDTNALVFLIRNEPPRPTLQWARCSERGAALKNWIAAGLPTMNARSLEVVERQLEEAVQTGLSRRPHLGGTNEIPLLQLARVTRGIATGCNEYFFLTREQAEALEIPARYLRRAVGRTRDVNGARITAEELEELDRLGRPTFLFAPDGQDIEKFPPSVRRYLEEGIELGIPNRALVKTRNPWYKMEKRAVPPFLFAYLGRRNARFIRNEAGVVPLTGFLCVYPRQTDPEHLARLWAVLSHPTTVANLSRVGKSYGGGAIKVEPRSLEKLPIPLELLEENGISLQTLDADKQLALV
jgi:adenine-specific DNA-methyltransferase